MSGIYIPGMEMPENCFKCPAHEWYDFGGANHGYQCPILRTTKCISNCEARTKRRDNCPMIPVPDHGRLVDVAELKKRAVEIKNFDNPKTKAVVLGAIYCSKTIIPADREDA